jgi:hypothetical protein
VILLNRNVLIISDRLGLRNFGHSNFIPRKSNWDLSSCRNAVMVILNLIIWERSHRMGWIIYTMELVFKVLMSICKMRLIRLSRWVRFSKQLSIGLLSPLRVSQAVILDLFSIYIWLNRTIFIYDLSQMHNMRLALLFLVFYRSWATLFNFIILLRELSIDRTSLISSWKKSRILSVARSITVHIELEMRWFVANTEAHHITDPIAFRVKLVSGKVLVEPTIVSVSCRYRPWRIIIFKILMQTGDLITIVPSDGVVIILDQRWCEWLIFQPTQSSVSAVCPRVL